MSIDLTKSQIRQACLQQRAQLSPDFVYQASQIIIATVQKLPAYQQANHIAWYHPIRGEIDMSGLWQQALIQGKHCYLPVIQPNRRMQFVPFTADTPWVLNHYHIPEPDSDPTLPSDPALDIIFVPMVAFDAQHHRLGMGQGYYDRSLAQYPKSLFIGLAYEWQKQPTIPHDSWDISIDLIITEQQHYATEERNIFKQRPQL